MIGLKSAAVLNRFFTCKVKLWPGPIIVPTGVSELAAATAFCTSVSVRPLAASASGLAWTRTANFCAP
jgi:hypothetical protein